MPTKTTIFQSANVQILIHCISSEWGGNEAYTPHVIVECAHCLGARVDVQKVAAISFAANYGEIQKAQHAVELGATVTVPQPVFRQDVLDEEDMETVIAEMQEFLKRRPLVWGQRFERKVYYIQTSQEVEQWTLTEGWKSGGFENWELVSPEVRALVPDKVVQFCDRLAVFFEANRQLHFQERREDEKRALQNERGL